MRDQLSQLVAHLENFQAVLVAKGKAIERFHAGLYTSTGAQPVLFAHHLLPM